MGSEILIRPATLGDIDELGMLFDLYRRFYAQSPDASLARAFISSRLKRKESVVLVAHRGATARLLGFTQLYPTFCSVSAAAIYVLYDLFVLPDSRRLGVGRALLRSAEGSACASACTICPIFATVVGCGRDAKAAIASSVRRRYRVAPSCRVRSVGRGEFCRT